MTTYSTPGFWYETDPVSGDVTAWGASALDWVVRDGTTSYSWSYGDDPGGGLLPPVTFDPPFVNARIDGEVRDGTSNTIFLSEFGDGSVRTPVLEVKDSVSGRTYVFPLGGDPYPQFETVQELTDILDGTSNTLLLPEDAFGPNRLIDITDGTSNTLLIGENDAVRGDDGRDSFWGGIGRDRIWGYGGDDILYGEDGADRLVGGADEDNLFGGSGADELDGGTGGDRVFGADGDDAIAGGTGQDALFGGAGNDAVRGNGGSDLVEGGAGNDTLVGGSGGDVFVFRAGAGEDRIRDFVAGDKLALDAALAGTASTGAEVVAAFATEFDGDVLLNFDDGTAILVLNVLATDLAPAIEIV